MKKSEFSTAEKTKLVRIIRATQQLSKQEKFSLSEKVRKL